MLVANATKGNVYLSAGRGLGISVRFTAKGDEQSVYDLDDGVWKGNRNLEKMLNNGTLATGPDVQVGSYPPPPREYHDLIPVDRLCVRSIVLGSHEEFERNAIFTPMGGPQTANSRANVKYIQERMIPRHEIALAWLDSLFEATADKEYKSRASELRKHNSVLAKLQ